MATAITPAIWRALGLPVPEPEYKFHPTRRWRVDLAFPDQKLAVEIEGGVWTRGRHTRPSGYLKDVEKYNELSLLGWRLLRVTPKQMKSGEAFELIRRAIGETDG